MFRTPLRRARRSSVFLALCALLSAACAETPAPAPTRSGQPDLLLVTIDTLRVDHLGCYGYERDTSPTIDALAKSGTRFETAYAPMSTTGPSHAALFTSKHPVELGMVRNGLVLSPGANTLAETLSLLGYYTAAFASTALFDPQLGLSQGFLKYDAEVSPYNPRDPEEGLERVAGDTVDACVEWLQSAVIERPLFLFVHFYDPHEPYSSPAEDSERFVEADMRPRKVDVAHYDAEIRYVDRELGRLLGQLDQLRTERPLLIALTADHGQAFWERGWTGHNAFTYDEELRIPLIIKGPGSKPGTVISDPIHTVDVVPTLLALLGLADPLSEDRRGLDLTPLMSGSETSNFSNRPLLLHRPIRPHSKRHAGKPLKGYGFGLRMGNWKYFEAKEENLRELYDLRSDPIELKNLAAERADLSDQLSAVIAHFMLSMGGDPKNIDTQLDPEFIDSLRRLGYLGENEE